MAVAVAVGRNNRLMLLTKGQLIPMETRQAMKLNPAVCLMVMAMLQGLMVET